MDNFFSGDVVLNYQGGQGWKATMTCRCDHLPNKVDKKYFNYIKVVPVNDQSKVARFEQPIIAVKHVIQANGKSNFWEERLYLNSCLISIDRWDNHLFGECSFFSGRGNQKRSRGTERNEARETYLKTYSAEDKIDQMLLGWDVSYCSWKWWHTPTRHAQAIAMSMAYSIYVQCSEGDVDPNWKVMLISATKFRQRLLSQMVNYKASDLMYPGDDKMCGATHKNKQGMEQMKLLQ